MTQAAPLSVLLSLLGRAEDDLVNIFTLPDGHSHWTTCGQAASVAAELAGTSNVYFGIQPSGRPESGRGKSKDVTSLVTLYADLDFAHEHKPNGVSPAVALEIIADLSDVLGQEPTAIVASGYGMQPYWPVTPMDPQHGILLLLRWRQMVIRVADAHGATIDTGVYDLPRILRVPGPPNLKYDTSKPTGLVVRHQLPPLAADAVTKALDAHLASSGMSVIEPRSLHDSGLPRSRESVASSGRVFTDAQAFDYMETHGLSVIRDTPWSSGEDYWKVLWERTQAIAMFSEMFDEEDLKDMIRSAIFDGHGEHADNADEYQIALGFIKFDGEYARRPTAEEALDPFSSHYTGGTTLAEYRERYDIPEKITPTTEIAYVANTGDVSYVDEETGEIVPLETFSDVRRLRVTFGHQMTMEAATWLWEHDEEFWLPLRSLVLLGGREGVGKSTWTARLISQVTNGSMKGEFLGQPKGVIIAAAEDSWESTILPRLVAAGADLKRVMRVEAEQSGLTFGLTLPTDVPALEKLVQEHDVALIVLDPLLGTVGTRLDTHKDSDVRQALAPMSALAHETHATIVGLIHQNKSQGGDLLTRLMGSRAFAAVARAVLVCAETEQENEEGDESPEHRSRQFSFGQLKNNLGPKVRTSVMYEIEGCVVGADPSTGKPIRTSRIKVLKDSTGAYVRGDDVEDMVLAKEKGEREKTDRRRAPGGNQIDRCTEVIRLALLEGPATSAELKAITSAAGYSDSVHKRAVASPALDLVKAGTHHAPIYSLPVHALPSVTPRTTQDNIDDWQARNGAEA